jgi:hypothetical protein
MKNFHFESGYYRLRHNNEDDSRSVIDLATQKELLEIDYRFYISANGKILGRLLVGAEDNWELYLQETSTVHTLGVKCEGYNWGGIADAEIAAAKVLLTKKPSVLHNQNQ